MRRTKFDSMSQQNVVLAVPDEMQNRLGENTEIRMFPLDSFVVECECGQKHREYLYLDMYFRGPDHAIESEGWTISSPIENRNDSVVNFCIDCKGKLKTNKISRCYLCNAAKSKPTVDQNITTVDPSRLGATSI